MTAKSGPPTDGRRDSASLASSSESEDGGVSSYPPHKKPRLTPIAPTTTPAPPQDMQANGCFTTGSAPSSSVAASCATRRALQPPPPPPVYGGAAPIPGPTHAEPPPPEPGPFNGSSLSLATTTAGNKAAIETVYQVKLMSRKDKDIVRLIGQHLQSLGLKCAFFAFSISSSIIQYACDIFFLFGFPFL